MSGEHKKRLTKYIQQKKTERTYNKLREPKPNLDFTTIL